MSRLRSGILAALGLSALMVLALMGSSGRSFGNRVPLPVRVADRLVVGLGHGIDTAWGWLVRDAGAEEALEFKPVPPESAAPLEGRRPRGAAAPAVPATPSEPPEPPAPPSPNIVTKSGDVMRIGSDIHVARNEVISGDLLAVGGDISVDGHVTGDVVAMGGDVRLSATARVDGDVASIGGELSEEPGAYVGGQRVTASGIRGGRHWRPYVVPHPLRGALRAGHVVQSMIWLLILLAIAWAFSTLVPGRTTAALETLRRDTALSLGIGALVWALIIPSVVALALVVAILCITIIGIPLALAALLGYSVFLGVLWVWGYVVGALGVGEWASGRIRHATPSSPGSGATPLPEASGGGAGPGAPGGTPVAPSAMPLAQKAMLGVLIVSGSGLAGELLQTLSFLPPIHGLGVFVSVLSTIAGALAATFGAGALLRSELKSGTLGRWWGGRRSVAAAPAGSAPPAGAAEPESPPPAVG